MAIKTVGVLGCGLMGAGIAQISAAAGFKTFVLEVNEDVLKKGLGRIDKFLTGGVEKGKVTEEQKKTVLGNLTGTTNYADLKDCDLVIEAIIENVEVKKQAYAQVEAVVGAALPDRVEHLIALHHRARRRHQAARQGRRAALLQSGAADEAGRSDPRARDQPGDARCADGICQGDRQGADHRARSRRLHRQSPARAVPARRDPLPRGRPRHRRRTSTTA